MVDELPRKQTLEDALKGSNNEGVASSLDSMNGLPIIDRENVMMGAHYQKAKAEFQATLEGTSKTNPFALGKYGYGLELMRDDSEMSRTLATNLGFGTALELIKGRGPIDKDALLAYLDKERQSGRLTPQKLREGIEALRNLRAYINGVRKALLELKDEFKDSGNEDALRGIDIGLEGDSYFGTAGLNDPKVAENMNKIRECIDVAEQFVSRWDIPSGQSTVSTGYVPL